MVRQSLTSYSSPASFNTKDWKHAFVMHVLTKKTLKGYKKQDRCSWHSVPATYWQEALGTSYRRTIDYLSAEGFIEVNEKYKVGSDGTKGFCKSYRLNQGFRKEVRAAKLNSVNLRAPKPPKKNFEDNSILETYTAMKMHDNITESTIAPDPVDPDIEVELAAVKFGSFNVKRSEKTGRYTHRLLTNSRESRKYLRVHGEELVEVDMKSCHFYLMTQFIDNEEERAKWIRWLESGIYHRLAEGWKHPTSMDRIKRCAQHALARKEMGALGRYILERLCREFPSLSRWLDSLTETAQAVLQRAEADFMVEKVFVSADFWTVPMHDGLLVKKSDAQRALNHIKECWQEVAGFEAACSIK